MDTASPGLMLLVVCLVLCSFDGSPCPSGCDCTDGTMNCDLDDTNGQIVSDLPDDITHVMLHDWGCWNLTWNIVTHLELLDTRFACRLPILQISNLKSLRIYTFDLYSHFDILNLQSNLGLKELYLIGNKNLSFKNIINLLDGSRFLDLEVLVIDRISSRNDDPILTASSDFFEMLSKKPELRRLELVNLNLNELDILASRCPPRLGHLSFKGSVINKLKTYYDDGQTHVCDSLNTLDLSETHVRAVRELFIAFPIFFSNSYISSDYIKLYLFKYFFNAETFIAKKINIQPLAVRGITLDMAAVKTHFKRVDISHNNLNFFNVSVIFPTDAALEEYNLSSYSLEYLGPNILRPVTFLRKMILDSNNLHKMQQEHWTDFEVVFHSYVNLEYLDLSSNRLTAIPQNMFINNERLVHLDLSNNQLTSISFRLNKCVSLKYLNLGKINILIREFSHISPLKSLISSTLKHQDLVRSNRLNESSYLTINLIGNSFQCTCNNEDLRKWLDNSNVFYNVNTENNSAVSQYLCNFKGVQYNVITAQTAAITDYCNHQARIRLILICTAATVATSLICCLLGFFIRRQIIRRRQLRTLLKYLHNDDLPLEYLIFLSHCSADDELVINYVMPSLSVAMKKVTGAKRDYLCNGDKHFRPGHTIIEEVMRSVEKSAVVILVISNKYIQSPWCDMEAKEAATQQKPVILILTETIDESEMSSVLKQMFNRYTRFKCRTNDNGQHEVTPSWEMLCSSVLDLASVAMKA